MYKDIIQKIKPELEKIANHLKEEVDKIHSSRVNPSLVEDLEVDCFGQKTPLKQLGTILAPQPNQITIEPWDKSYVQPIEKAISQSDIGATPNVSGETIRLNFPLLTEEYKEKLFRSISEKLEEARQNIRHWRKESWEEIQQAFKDGGIREDEKFKGKDDLQKVVDEYNKKVEGIIENKKKEIKG